MHHRMLNTSRNLVRGDCTHYKAGFDPHKSCYGCRFYKRPKADPCAWEGPDNCVACQELSPEQKEQLKRTFAKRLARRCKTKANRATKMATASFDEGERDEREAGEIDQSVEDELLGEPVIQPRAGTSGATQQASHTPAPRPSPATAGISPLIHQTAQAHIQPPQVLVSQTAMLASTVFSQPPPQTVYVQQPQQPQTVSQPTTSFVFPQAPIQQAPVQQAQHVPTPQRTANLTVPQTPRTQVLQAQCCRKWNRGRTRN